MLKKPTTMVVTVVILSISGCMSSDPIVFDDSDRGANPKELVDAADQQDTSISIISNEATNVYANATKPTVKDSAVTIISETKKLEDIAELLRREAESNKKIAVLQARLVKLEEEKKTGEARFMLWLKILGILCVPAGLAIAYFSKSLKPLAFCLMGIALMVATQLDAFIVKYGPYFIWVGIAVAAWISYSVMHDSRRSLRGAVGVAETLKQVLKEKDPDAIKHLFGDGAVKGVVAHDPITERLILAERKRILKQAKPVSEQI